MRNKVLVLATLVLALMFPILTQQTFAEEDVRYVYPVIETDCDHINATAYRFHPGNTLNFTYIFTTSGYTYTYIPKNYTTNVETEYPPGYVTSTDFARFYWFEWIDGIGGPGHNEGFMIAGDGSSLGYMRYGFSEAGEHTIKVMYLFKAYGDYEGFFEMNFLSERKVRLEEIDSPLPTLPVLISGVSGAGIAFAISAVIWHKRKLAKKEEPDVNP